MYSVTQLNDLLIPELADIAASMNIPISKKTTRQELISLILEKQEHMAPVKKNNEEEKKFSMRSSITRETKVNSLSLPPV